jgi:hypothetical protein
MEKLSAEKIAAVLTEVPSTLRALDEDRNQWRDRALEAEAGMAKIAMRERITKIAGEMASKGLDAGRSMEERIQLLEKKATEGRLDAIEEAVGMSPGSRPLGEIVEQLPGQASSDLESFIMGDLV